MTLDELTSEKQKLWSVTGNITRDPSSILNRNRRNLSDKRVNAILSIT